MEYLGLDIWMQILSGLSVKDLIRLKCVSKTFLELISSLVSNHNFIRLHLNKSSFRAIHLNRHSYLGLKQHGETESSLRAIHINRQTFLNYGKQHVGEEVETMCYATSYGSCNGLVCLWPKHNNNKYGGGVLLWNPALCRAEFIPIKRPQQIFESCRLCWFGYDDDEYKLIIGTASHFHLIRLYNAWKSSHKIDKNYGPCEDMGTLVHRAVHWPAYYRNDRKLTIISYDLSNETVGWIATPYEMTKLYPFVLGQVDGCLSTVFGNHNHLHYQMELWVMKEYGVQESWTKLMNLPSNILRTYRGLTRGPYAVELDDPAQLNSPIYGKHFYVESLISPRSIKTMMC